MSFGSLIPLLAVLCNLPIVVLVLTQNIRKDIRWVYLLWGTALIMWNFGTFHMFLTPSDQPERAIFWARFLQFGVIMGPIALMHLALLIAQVKMPKFLSWLYLLHFLLALTNFTSFFVKSTVYVDKINAWYCVAGPGFWIWSFAYVMTFYSVAVLIAKRKILPPLHRHRLDIIILAQSTLIVGGMNDVLPIIGLFHYPFTNISVFPFGSVCAIFYGLLVGYALLQHRLLNINLVLGQMAAKLVRIAIVWIASMLLLLLIGIFSPEGNFPPFAFLASMTVIIITTIGATIFFPRLFGEGSGRMESRLLGDHFEYHDKVREFINSVQGYTDMRLLLDDLHDLLTDVVHVKGYQILLLDDRSKEFTPTRCRPKESCKLLPVISQDSEITRLFERRGLSHFAFNIRYSEPGSDNLENEVRAKFNTLSPELCFCFRVAREPIGFFLVSEKTSNEPYTSVDIELLTSLIANLSLIINQDRLKQQLLVTQEHDLLGRMSRGIAHDLNNLLTPVLTFLQLAEEGLDGPEMQNELLPTALRNVETAGQYIRESLFFSEHSKPNLAPTNISKLLQEVTDIAHSQWRKKGISIILDVPDDLIAEVDPLLFKRVLTNLLSNAVDASPHNGAIEMSASLSSPSDKRHDWLRLIVRDHGEGISEDNIKKIGQPYFTTKDTGSGTRGFGLGLAICRRILQLHGGTWRISSQLGQGAEFRLEIPAGTAKTEDLVEA